MGQDFGQIDEWNENRSLEWELLEYPLHSQMKEYVKALNQLYASHPALYELDDEPEGFQWINCTYQADNIAIFIRRSKKPEETLLFVCNFAPVPHEKFRIGVPFAGKYKEILNSDAVPFGGSGMGNPRAKSSKKEEWDERENSIQINIPPMAVCVFQCTPEPAGKKGVSKGKKAVTSKKPEAKKAAGRTQEKAAGKKEETKKPEPETAAGTGARKAGTSEALKEKEPEISETVKKGRKGRASEALDMISERVGRLIKK